MRIERTLSQPDASHSDRDGGAMSSTSSSEAWIFDDAAEILSGRIDSTQNKRR
jgi:hypothetical protein